MQNSLCVQILRSPILAALLHGTRVVGVSQTAALSRGRHLYSAGRPSRWALAHILVYHYLNIFTPVTADCGVVTGCHSVLCGRASTRQLVESRSLRFSLTQLHMVDGSRARDAFTLNCAASRRAAISVGTEPSIFYTDKQTDRPTDGRTNGDVLQYTRAL